MTRDPSPSSARIPWGAVFLCACVALLEGYDIQAMGVAAGKMLPRYHLDSAEAGWALSANMIGLIIAATLGGAVADRVGRRPLLVAGTAAFGAFTLATLYAPGFSSLIAARIGVGLGLGAVMPNLIAAASDMTPLGRRTTVTTLVFCGMSVGGALAATLAWRPPPGFDWRLIFIVGGAVPLALAPLVALALPETAPSHARQTWAAVSRAVLGEGRLPATLALWTAYALTLVMLYLLLNWLPSLVAARGIARSEAPLASVMFNLASLVGAPLLGVLIDRHDVRWPMGFAYAGVALTVLALSRASGEAPIMILSGLTGFGVIGAQFALYGLSPSYYPEAVRGAGAGAAVSVGRLGSVAGPVIAGYLLKAGVTAAGVMTLLAPAALIAGAAILVLSRIGVRDVHLAEAADR